MRLRIAVAGAVLAAVALSGCAGEAPGEESPSTEPTASVPATVEPSAEPEPTGPPALACNTLITQETLDGFEAAGYVHEVDYESQVRSEGSIEELFFDYGGLACMWYLPNSDGWFTAAYSPITETQATEAQARLEAEGYLRAEEGSDVVYTIDPSTNMLGHNDTYLFEPGAWYHSNHPEGVDEIRGEVADRR
ncbi:hypothetical protein OH146_12710 [Salinibacterium sp. SYSU T00001]|uniref:hypothetical protein n=1 Tax=Homoserinimonas sedimenticola TaxID=2986805 RepID=UPI00223685E0|nr:hypothetical protein [Salinibacterium sedimenticola]MCW4386635.1 hypothetical protein [Salinibacterium sedimenticola]